MAQQKAAEPATVDEVDDLIDELQPGAKLLKGQYTITRYLNSGGFGITYLAKDSLDRDVVIKECFPSSFCRRSKTVVAARSRAHTAELRSIVQLFVREARNLAKIVHPNIVAVHQVFEDNGTAYMAIDFIDGLDLQQVIDGEGPRLTPEHIVTITDKLLVAVGFIHQNDMLHRDISPDNVLINKEGEPILIDFGAAREHASQSTRTMSALRVVKDGYSPQEFYIAGSEQGPWSDLYALAATLYHLISGEAPVNGQARLAALAEDRADPYVPLTGKYLGYPDGFLEAIDRAMSALPKQRLQSADAWRAMFGAISAAPATATDGTAAAVHHLVEASRRLSDSAATVPADAAAATSLRDETVPTPAASARGKGGLVVAAGFVTAVALGAGYYLMSRTEVPQSGPATQAAASETAATAAAEDAVAPTLAAAPEASGTPAAPAEEAAAAPAATAAATTVEAQPAAETSAPAPAAETAATEAIAPAEEPAEVQTEVAAVEAEAGPATATEAPAAPVGTPSANQVAFAAWDINMPFQTADRIVGGQRVAVITRLVPSFDPAITGDWIASGVQIHSVNGAPVASANGLTLGIMNAMSVDPDGKARVVIEYTDSSGSRKSGLLTVESVRLVNLANGVGLRARVDNGTWKTEVTGVADPARTGLRQGDILFRDKTTGIPLDGPTSIEAVMAGLIAQGTTQTAFSIIRDNKVSEAVMQLVLDGGQ